MNMSGYEQSMKMDETAKNGRTLKDLNLTDDFLFDITTENLENCKYEITEVKKARGCRNGMKEIFRKEQGFIRH